MSENNGRDPQTGRALPGSKLALGNRGGHTIQRRVNELRRVIVETETDDDVRQAFRKLRTLGMDGDVAALRLYLEYTCGKPKSELEISGPDGASLDISSVVAVIMAAVGDNQDMRIRIASAFHRLGSGRTSPESDGQIPLPGDRGTGTDRG
jgi:hypothetical protein